MEEGIADAQFVNVQPVNNSNIFLPIGSVVPKTDWATLRFDLDINKIQNETNHLCLLVEIIPKFIKKRVSKVLSKPNKNVLKVLFKNIKTSARKIWMQFNKYFLVSDSSIQSKTMMLKLGVERDDNLLYLQPWRSPVWQHIFPPRS